MFTSLFGLSLFVWLKYNIIILKLCLKSVIILKLFRIENIELTKENNSFLCIEGGNWFCIIFGTEQSFDNIYYISIF